jgi:hypothetical protein
MESQSGGLMTTDDVINVFVELTFDLKKKYVRNITFVPLLHGICREYSSTAAIPQVNLLIGRATTHAKYFRTVSNILVL